MDHSQDVLDPLRFGAEEDDLQDEVPLHDEPPLAQPAYAEEQPAAQPAAAAPLYATATVAASHTPPPGPGEDPLSLASRGGDAGGGGSGGYARPASAPGSAQPLLAPTGTGLAPAPAPLRATDSRASEITSEDASWLQQGAAASGHAPAMRITVTDPVKRVSDSIIPGVKGGHYEYLVSTVAENPRRRVEVRRRFNDFVALAELLSTTHRGYFVFPRPDKNSLEVQVWTLPHAAQLLTRIRKMGKRDFIETRRTDLERYLNKLAQHPVVGHSEELKVFLEAEGPLSASFPWQQLQPVKGSLLEGVARLPRQLIGSDSSVPSTVEAATNARHTSDLLRRFREAGERMRQEYKAPPALNEDEARLRGDRTVVEEYEEKVAVSLRTEQL